MQAEPLREVAGMLRLTATRADRVSATSIQLEVNTVLKIADLLSRAAEALDAAGGV